jgi:ferrous iron transport protein A
VSQLIDRCLSQVNAESGEFIYNENHSYLDSALKMLHLNQIPTQVWHRIDGHAVVNPRLAALGFLPAEPVRVLRRSWWKRGALVVQVGNATFALRDNEAAQIAVECAPS